MKMKNINRSTKRRQFRYSAKLLFQYRVIVNGKSDSRRLCEKRIIIIKSKSARSALSEAKKYGKREELHHDNLDGSQWHLEFVGVQDLLELGIGCGKEEVWYDIVEKLKPMKRKQKLIPPENQLNAILNEKR